MLNKIENLEDYFKSANCQSMLQERLSDNAWTLGDKSLLGLKEKIERVGKPLKEWNVKIYFGIKTGFNDAFIIDTETRNRILANCKDEEERKITEAIIKPVLRGRDIERYRYKWAGLWIILIPAGWTRKNSSKEEKSIKDYETWFKTHYTSLYQHLIKYTTVGNRRGESIIDRPSQGEFWWELQTGYNVIDEFGKEKIVWTGVGSKLETAIGPRKFFIMAPANFLTGNNLYFLQGLLNSKLVVWYYEIVKTRLGGKGGRFYLYDILNLPIIFITSQNQLLVARIVQKVDEILMFTQSIDYEVNLEKQRRVKELEKEIDDLVYELYELTDDEIKMIEKVCGV